MIETEYTTCTGCGAPHATGEDGEIAVCMVCGHLAVWIDGTWCEPEPEHRARLLAMPEVIDAIVSGTAVAEHREQDKRRVTAMATPWLLLLAENRVTVDEAARGIAEALHDKGFHTHPGQVDR
jgi:uncharacterized Zn finger protein (UPF0148 family)